MGSMQLLGTINTYINDKTKCMTSLKKKDKSCWHDVFRGDTKRVGCRDNILLKFNF